MSSSDRNANWDLRKLNADGYKAGSIIRVRMVNFLTYDECEVFPGPRLNIILGPNGTGKSTVTHAIYLACNGSAGQLGRSSDLTKYVKNGKENEESYVEVDIYDKDEVHTIRRIIDPEKKSSKWKYNHNEVKQIQIKELMKKLKIDVENLCNFMSQDKVGSFSTFKANEILQATLKCINLNSDGDEEKTLHDEQLALAHVENDKREKEREKDSKQTVYDDLLNQLALMQREYDRFIERSETKKKLELYEIKLVFEQIKDMSNKVKEKQLLVDQATKLLLDAEKSILPLETKERDLKRFQAIKAKNVDNCKEKMTSSERAMLSRKEDITQAEVALDGIYTDLEFMDQQRKKMEDSRKSKIEDLKKAEKELLDLNDRLPDIQRKLEALSIEIKNLATEQDVCQLACDEKDSLLKKKKDEINFVRRDLGNLKDSKEIFLKKVQNSAYVFKQDAIKLINLLRDQQQWKAERKITHEIYGPISMYINVKDPAAAAMVEKCIPNNKLYGVIVQSDNDRKFLHKIFIDRNMRVDIYTMNEINPSDTTPIKNIATTFRDIGMQGYLLDQVETNNVVRAFLISNLHLHTVMWMKQLPANREITDDDTNRFMGSGRYYKFFKYKPDLNSGRQLYIQEFNGSKSKYAKDGKINISVSKVQKDGFIICGSSDSSNDGDKLTLEAKYEKLANEIKLIETERKPIADKFRDLIDQRNSCQEKKRQLQAAYKQPDLVKNRISVLEKQIKDLDQKLSSDSNKDKLDKQVAYRSALSKFISHVDILVTASNTYRDLKVDWMVALESKKALTVEVDRAVDAAREAKAGLEQYKQDVRSLERNREEIELQKKRFTKKLEDLNVKHGGDAKLKVLSEKAFRELPEHTVDELEQKVTYLDQELKGAVDNSSIVERYKNTEAKLAQSKVELDSLISACDSKRDFFLERSNHWQNSILALATKMDSSFKTFMNQLQYDGAVKLRQTGSITDYEMVMEVCFRLNSTLVELSGNKHSGGERAVSTIMYLMAMQALTSSPFRVVDEINQGMDERNERLVFDRIVSTCCGNISMPQYFLVSPKLLQGLNAMDHSDVTVLLVFNGPGVKSTWNLKDVIYGLKRNLDPDSKENKFVSNKKTKLVRG